VTPLLHSPGLWDIGQLDGEREGVGLCEKTYRWRRRLEANGRIQDGVKTFHFHVGPS